MTASHRFPRRLVVALLCAALGTGCARSARWAVEDNPTPEDAAALLAARDPEELRRYTLAQNVPDVPVRGTLRPCCAFGSDLQVKLSVLPIPLFALGNLLGPEEIGEHTYDAGVLMLKPPGGYRPSELAPFERERNGLIYTCHGGFVDTAHVRDYVDWGLFVGSRVAMKLEEGGSFELPDEGGQRRVRVKAIDPELRDRIGVERLIITLAQWLSFQLSVWHEIATWYGWVSVLGFSEEASAFSPEDLYSNLVGVKLLAGIAQSQAARGEHLYNDSVDTWLHQVLHYLAAQPKEIAAEAARSVDGLWWDSTKRVPDKSLVLRRSFAFGDPLAPWLVPPERASDALREACGESPQPLLLSNPDSFLDVRFRDWVTFEIDVDDAIASRPPFDRLGRRVTQDDFPAIIRAIRKQNAEEFGPEADRPS